METITIQKSKTGINACILEITDFIPNGNAEFTGRILPEHQKEFVEMVETGTIGNRAVKVFYLITEEESQREDFSGINWIDRVSRIEDDEDDE